YPTVSLFIDCIFVNQPWGPLISEMENCGKKSSAARASQGRARTPTKTVSKAILRASIELSLPLRRAGVESSPARIEQIESLYSCSRDCQRNSPGPSVLGTGRRIPTCFPGLAHLFRLGFHAFIFTKNYECSKSLAGRHQMAGVRLHDQPDVAARLKLERIR